MARPLLVPEGPYSMAANCASFEITSTKQTGPKRDPAENMKNRPAKNAGAKEDAVMNRRPAIRDRRTTDVRATTVVKNNSPPRANERETAEKFAAIVCRISPETLAEAAGGRSVEVAKLWKSGRRCPNTTSLLSMAKSLPAVAAWVEDEILPEKRQPSTPVPDLGAVVAKLQARALMGGEDAAIARAMLALLTGAG